MASNQACRIAIAASLLLATPLFPDSWIPVDPRIDKGVFEWFSLTESKQDVVRLLGPPKLEGQAGPEFTGWQYVFGEIDDEDFSHYLVFSKDAGTLVSVSRNFYPEHNVDLYFPVSESVSYALPTLNGGAAFRVRVRRLPGDMFLLAMGVSKPGERCGQIVLIRQPALRVFYPALAAAM